MENDIELLDKIKSNDQLAFSKLYDKYKHLIYFYAKKFW